MRGAARTLSGRPLRATAADAALYVPFTEIERQLERAIGRELNVLLLGRRGGGKTSLLRHLEFAYADDGGIELKYVNPAPVASALEVVELIRQAMHAPPSVRERQAAFGGQDARRATEVELLLDRIRTLRRTAPSVLLIDSLSRGQILHELFGNLRDELWELPHSWIVAADVGQRAAALAPPADAFFDVVLTLPEPDEAQQRAILARRGADDAIDVLAREGLYDSPRRLLSAARSVIVGGRPAEQVVAAATARRRAAATLGTSAAAMLEQLEDLDRPVSASDEELLRRLGITRERAAQVLNRLERAGAVDSMLEPTGAKPRKLFFIVDGTDAG